MNVVNWILGALTSLASVVVLVLVVLPTMWTVPTSVDPGVQFWTTGFTFLILAGWLCWTYGDQDINYTVSWKMNIALALAALSTGLGVLTLLVVAFLPRMMDTDSVDQVREIAVTCVLGLVDGIFLIIVAGANDRARRLLRASAARVPAA